MAMTLMVVMCVFLCGGSLSQSSASAERSVGYWPPEEDVRAALESFDAYPMGEINAVLTIEQLKRVRGIVSKRHRLGEKLAAGIEGLPGVELLRPPSHCKSSYWYGVLLVDRNEAGIDGPGFAKALAAEGIRASATEMANRSVRVHLNEFVTDRDVRDTILAIHKVAAWYRGGGSG